MNNDSVEKVCERVNTDSYFEDVWLDSPIGSFFRRQSPSFTLSSIQAKGNEWSKRLDDTYTNLLKRAKIDKESRRYFLEKIQLVEKREKVARKWREKHVVRLRHKISFVLGVGNIFAAAYLLGRVPAWIPEWYTIWAILLISLRFFIYKSKSRHYFVLDLCYFVNLLVALYLWAFPMSGLLFSAVFCLTHGPLIWAVITSRNSMVFHSLDKVTSSFIHLGPPFTLYTIRWLVPASAESFMRYGSYANQQRNGAPDNVMFINAICVSFLFYLIWQAGYYALVFVWKKEKVFQGKRVTSVTWLLGDKSTLIGQLAEMFGEQYKIYTFMGMHLVYAVTTMMPTVLLYHHFWVHTLFLLLISLVNLWNGSAYYFDVFSERYVKELQELSDEITKAE